MNATAYDTLTAMRALEAAGMERRQAEAVAEQLRTAADAGQDDLATKADIVAAGVQHNAEIAIVPAELRAIRWMLGFQAALIIAMAARLFGLV